MLAFRQDLEQQLREQVREAIETVLEAELTAALGSGRHERTARRAGYRHGTVDRTLTTRDGVRQLRVPRGRVRHADGTTREFRSQLIPRYARRTREVDAAILSSYLAGREQSTDSGGLAAAAGRPTSLEERRLADRRAVEGVVRDLADAPPWPTSATPCCSSMACT